LHGGNRPGALLRRGSAGTAMELHGLGGGECRSGHGLFLPSFSGYGNAADSQPGKGVHAHFGVTKSAIPRDAGTSAIFRFALREKTDFCRKLGGSYVHAGMEITAVHATAAFCIHSAHNAARGTVEMKADGLFDYP